MFGPYIHRNCLHLHVAQRDAKSGKMCNLKRGKICGGQITTGFARDWLEKTESFELKIDYVITMS